MAINIVVNEVKREKREIPAIVGDVYFSGAYHYQLVEAVSGDVGGYYLVHIDMGRAYYFPTIESVSDLIGGWTHFPKATLTVKKEVD